MIASESPIWRIAKIVLGGAVFLAFLGILALLATNGSKTGLALTAVAAFGPVALYFGMKRPLVFPFAFYAFMVPFDNLLTIAHFGTVTKLLAIICGAAMVYYLMRNRTYVKPSRSLWLWGIAIVWMALSVLWAIDPKLSVTRLATFGELFLLFLGLSLLPARKQDLNIVLLAVCLGGVAASLYGAYLFHSGTAQFIQGAKITSGRVYLQNAENFIDPNHFGA